MKTLQATAFVSLLLGSLAAHAGTPFISLNVGGEVIPGVYGQVQIGNASPPPVVYAQPMIITQQPRNAELEPVYLHVPPGHANNWSRHCREYNACNRPVYFVKSAEYEPGYRGRNDGMRWDEGRSDEGRRDEGRRDEGRRDEHSGHGRGEGRGNGRRGEGRED